MMEGGPYSRPKRAVVPLGAGKNLYTPFTRVDGRRPQGIPRLEDTMAAYLVPGMSSWPSPRKPTLPTTKDQLTAQLVEKSFALEVQAVAAANNIALLAASLSLLTT